MVETSFNMFDLIVIAVVGLSALLSFFRGFIREVLSLGAWVGAAIVTLYAFPHVSEWLQTKVSNETVANGLASMGTFFVALIGIGMLLRLVGKYVKSGSDVGVLDNLLGIAFGGARGVLVVVIGFFIMHTFIGNEKPLWLEESVTAPHVEKAAEWLSQVAPEYMEDMLPAKSDDGIDLDINADEAREKLRRLKDEATDDKDATEKWESLDELRSRMGVD